MNKCKSPVNIYAACQHNYDLERRKQKYATIAFKTKDCLRNRVVDIVERLLINLDLYQPLFHSDSIHSPW